MCFVREALVPAAPCMESAAVLWPTGRRYCAQTLVPGRCRCCQPDRNGRLPPDGRNKEVKYPHSALTKSSATVKSGWKLK